MTESTDDRTWQEAEQALSSIRRRLGGHGGDVTIADVQDGTVHVTFHAACEHCPAQALTYVSAVRETLLQVPGVKEVRAPQVRDSRFALDRIASMLELTPFNRPVQTP
ncbi:Fe-S cluster biogenesis protein NfuA, 4Fe-4S-binding domain [Sinosporangium album]|uniref:Fe-S cluster biogenesis protein NfuA, 4Fe-4S-binding domain n=1 Tax=Sinosporangium album TaxID=504805 RepID=A0A1G8FPI4_9ACTN|nr:NifU family protein [Sinosporangium album]SDH83967.1 Fe-S cluster biogenesis protein NfuA, 4Fe-4S-binding domain [Sinosporangium album]